MINAIRLLVERGARWVPSDRGEVDRVRKSLLKLTPTYSAELTLIFSRHRACEKSQLEGLLSTPKIKAHVAKRWPQIQKLLHGWT
jgi:hypothetical protein